MRYHTGLGMTRVAILCQEGDTWTDSCRERVLSARAQNDCDFIWVVHRTVESLTAEAKEWLREHEVTPIHLGQLRLYTARILSELVGLGEGVGGRIEGDPLDAKVPP